MDRRRCEMMRNACQRDDGIQKPLVSTGLMMPNGLRDQKLLSRVLRVSVRAWPMVITSGEARYEGIFAAKYTTSHPPPRTG
jgi:hypothetical protein